MRQPDRVRSGRRTRLAVLASTVVAIALAVSGCTSTGKTIVCSEVGATGGVSVAVSPGVSAAASPMKLTVCAEGACRSRTVTRMPSRATFVPNDRLGPGNVRIDVTIEQRSRTIFRSGTTASTVKNQPNGPGCGPTVYGAGVVVRSDGTLDARN